MSGDGREVRQAWVTADEWFASGRRVWYDPESARVTEADTRQTPAAIQVFNRVVASEHDADSVWLTMLPGYPDGSYGWAQVDRMLGDELGPRLYVEPIGQGDSDKPQRYEYSTVERADLVQALWRYHGVRRTVIMTFDYTSLAVLELLRRQLERNTLDAEAPTITAVFMMNGGLFADSHSHPWQGTPLLRSPLGAFATKGMQRSVTAFSQAFVRARVYSHAYQPSSTELAEIWSAISRRNGAHFLHAAAGFVPEHRRNGKRWDLADIARELGGSVALYVGGSEEDPYEHRQIKAARERVREATVLTFPGGHMTTSEHPALLASAIRGIATRHGVEARTSSSSM